MLAGTLDLLLSGQSDPTGHYFFGHQLKLHRNLNRTENGNPVFDSGEDIALSGREFKTILRKDGLFDLIAYGANTPLGVQLIYYRNSGKPGAPVFNAATPVTVGGKFYPGEIGNRSAAIWDIGDLDGDGIPDLVFSTQPHDAFLNSILDRTPIWDGRSYRNSGPGRGYDITGNWLGREANPAVESRTEILGYSFIAGQGNTYGTFIVKLKDWSEREKGQDATSVLGQLYGAVGQQIKDATVMMFQPPMISGYSVTSGFELQLQDKTGGDINKFFQIYQQFIGALNQRPEIQQAYSTFNPTFPQYMVNVDVAKTKQAGISPSVVLSTLQGYYGGMYVSNFNRFGKLYRVMMQADPSARISPETLNQVKVRVGNEMSPITNFITLERVYGPDIISRFNLFTSISVSGTPNPGYSNGDAIKAIQEVAAQTLPMGYGYEFSGMTREEQNSSAASTAIVFGLCLLFVYLLLSAQYESYILPLSVILSIPLGLMGSFLFAKIFGVNNNIYLQIGLIMLIGLLAKNAILIVEFALDRRKTGMSIVGAAIAGAAARLRPILMTGFAMIIGLLPLMLANGVGANGNRSLGTGAVGGMLIGMILQVLIVPALFVAFQKIQEKIQPLKWKDTDNAEIDDQIEQYSRN